MFPLDHIRSKLGTLVPPKPKLLDSVRRILTALPVPQRNRGDTVDLDRRG